MMLVKNVKRNEDGSFDVNWQISAEQIGFLVTYAITDLVQQGLVTVEEKKESNKAQMQLDFLEEVPVDRLGSA